MSNTDEPIKAPQSKSKIIIGCGCLLFLGIGLGLLLVTGLLTSMGLILFGEDPEPLPFIYSPL